MDVEQIQKVNNLALELMNQGLAQTREEAVAQAERLLKGRGEEYSELRSKLEEVKVEAQEEKPKPELSSEEIKDILQQNSQFLIKKIREFQEQMKAMEQEIVLLKNKLANVSRPVIHQTTVKEEVQGSSKLEEHPRSGTYKDEDVSVEKFFYAGKKWVENIIKKLAPRDRDYKTWCYPLKNCKEII